MRALDDKRPELHSSTVSVRIPSLYLDEKIMKKAVAVAAGVVVLGAGWAGASWYSGKRIETEIRTHLAEYNQDLVSNTPLELTLLSYERGVFSSKARLGLEIENVEHGSQSLEFDADIQHGPFTPGALKYGHLLPQLGYIRTDLAKTEPVEPLFDITKGAVPVWADAVVSYRNNIAFTGNLAAMNHSQDETTINFSGLRLIGNINTSSKKVSAKAKVAELLLDQQNHYQPRKMHLTGITLGMNSQPGKFGLSIGDSAIQIKRIETTQLAENSQVDLDNFGIHANLSETDNDMNIHVVYNSGDLSVNNVAFGSGTLGIKIARLDGANVESFVSIYQHMLDSIQQNDWATLMGLAGEATDTTLKMLAVNPSIGISPLSWKTPEGESTLDLKLVLTRPNWTGTPTMDTAIETVKSIDAQMRLSKPMLLAIGTAAAKLQGAPAEMAEKMVNDAIQNYVDQGVAQNLLKIDGDNIVSTFSYADGMADLNGQTIPLEQFAPMLGMLSNMHSSYTDGDDAGQAQDETAAGPQNSMTAIADILEKFDLPFEKTNNQKGNIEYVLDASEFNANDLRIEFKQCDAATELCGDIVARASYKVGKGPSPAALAAWSKAHTGLRASLGSDGRLVLEATLTAYLQAGETSVANMLAYFFDEIIEFTPDNLTSAMAESHAQAQ